jgi:hypothetical protein
MPKRAAEVRMDELQLAGCLAKVSPLDEKVLSEHPED